MRTTKPDGFLITSSQPFKDVWLPGFIPPNPPASYSAGASCCAQSASRCKAQRLMPRRSLQLCRTFVHDSLTATGQPMESRRVWSGRQCSMGGPGANRSTLQHVEYTATLRGPQMRMGLVVSYTHQTSVTRIYSWSIRAYRVTRGPDECLGSLLRIAAEEVSPGGCSA